MVMTILMHDAKQQLRTFPVYAAQAEQQIEELLGQNGKWWMPDRGVMNKHDNSPVSHGEGTSDGVVPFSPHPHT